MFISIGYNILNNATAGSSIPVVHLTWGNDSNTWGNETATWGNV